MRLNVVAIPDDLISDKSCREGTSKETNYDTTDSKCSTVSRS